MPILTLTLLPERLAVCRLEPEASWPAWARSGPLVSLTRTREEVSIVCQERDVPAEVRQEGPWRCFQIQGPIPFTMVGVLASLTGPLAQAGISVFAVSTFDTDYLLVPEPKAAQAKAVLLQAGHQISGVI
jgi:hypothetical protein